jgi:hypothetical protein
MRTQNSKKFQNFGFCTIFFLKDLWNQPLENTKLENAKKDPFPPVTMYLKTSFAPVFMRVIGTTIIFERYILQIPLKMVPFSVRKPARLLAERTDNSTF